MRLGNYQKVDLCLGVNIFKNNQIFSFLLKIGRDFLSDDLAKNAICLHRDPSISIFTKIGKWLKKAYDGFGDLFRVVPKKSRFCQKIFFNYFI